MKEAKIQVALSRKHPAPVALVTCAGRDGTENALTVGWFMQTSLSPELLAISVGKTRFSHDIIFDSNEFVLCLPTPEQADAILYCGTHSGRDVDKFATTDLKRQKAKYVRAPLVANCSACFECGVVEKIESGDHTIFVGRIRSAYITDTGRSAILYDFGKCILKGLE